MADHPFKKDFPQRRSVRLDGYDYHRRGAYFLTINTRHGQPLFGNLRNGEMHLNRAGELVHESWNRSAQLRSEIALGPFIVMPNHIHGLVWIQTEWDDPLAPEAIAPVRAYGNTPVTPTPSQADLIRLRSPSRTIGSMIRGFKGDATRRINELQRQPGRTIWHRNYYLALVCKPDAYRRITQYILNNPRIHQSRNDRRRW